MGANTDAVRMTLRGQRVNRVQSQVSAYGVLFAIFIISVCLFTTKQSEDYTDHDYPLFSTFTKILRTKYKYVVDQYMLLFVCPSVFT